ncbi:MAG: hypothetical protein K2K68_01855 [Duncaniella sp.]|nr:hypothetical protein [Duncaniella sp.]
MIRNYITTVIISTVLALAAACSSGDRFEIDCEISGLDNGSVDMIYFNGGFNAVTAHASDSRVKLSGRTEIPALVDVWDSDGRLLFSLIAVNGDRLKVKMELDNPSSAVIEGNEESELLSRFRADNSALLAAGPSASLNLAVERFIMSNPSSRAATVALMTIYDLNADPVKADSLLNRLDADARNLTSIRDFSRTLAVASASVAYEQVRPITFHVSTDSTVEFIPYRHKYSLLAVTTSPADTSSARIMRALRSDFSDKKLNIVETSVVADSARWRASTAGDTATWSQTWLPGGLGNPTLSLLAIPAAPYFIAVDSTGKQLYRGFSPAEADSVLRSRIK